MAESRRDLEDRIEREVLAEGHAWSLGQLAAEIAKRVAEATGEGH